MARADSLVVQDTCITVLLRLAFSLPFEGDGDGLIRIGDDVIKTVDVHVNRISFNLN